MATREVTARPGPYRVVPLRRAHLSEIVRIEQQSFSDPWPAAAFVRELNNPFSRNMVALDEEGRVAGYAITWSAGPEFHVLNMAVRPDMRRRGVGRTLLSKVLRQAKKDGSEYLVLEVRPSNKPAVKLYTSMGFVSVGIRRKYYSDGEDAEVMIRLL